MQPIAALRDRRRSTRPAATTRTRSLHITATVEAPSATAPARTYLVQAYTPAPWATCGYDQHNRVWNQTDLTAEAACALIQRLSAWK